MSTPTNRGYWGLGLRPLRGLSPPPSGMGAPMPGPQGAGLSPVDIPALFDDGAGGTVAGDLFRADIDFLYQDRAGTVPVTEPSDPVRAIRGQVNGYLAAVEADDRFWTYQVDDGHGVLVGQSTGASRGFRIDRATVTSDTFFGTFDDDHGFVVAGLAFNLETNKDAVAVRSGNGVTQVSRFGGGGGTFRIQGPGFFTQDKLNPVGEWDIGDMYVQTPSDIMLTSPTERVSLIFARNPSFGYGIRIETSDTSPDDWFVDVLRYIDEDWNEIRESFPLPSYNIPGDPPFTTTGTWAEYGMFVFGRDHGTGAANVRHRAVLMVGKAVDPALYNRIMRAL